MQQCNTAVDNTAQYNGSPVQNTYFLSFINIASGAGDPDVDCFNQINNWKITQPLLKPRNLFTSKKQPSHCKSSGRKYCKSVETNPCSLVYCDMFVLVREGSGYQIGWIFGKIPNGLRPPPSFSENLQNEDWLNWCVAAFIATLAEQETHSRVRWRLNLKRFVRMYRTVRHAWQIFSPCILAIRSWQEKQLFVASL